MSRLDELVTKHAVGLYMMLFCTALGNNLPQARINAAAMLRATRL